MMKSVLPVSPNRMISSPSLKTTRFDIDAMRSQSFGVRYWSEFLDTGYRQVNLLFPAG
jgi:hypothetical protein